MPSALITVQYCYDYLINQISLGLLLYAHIPTAVTAIIFGSFILLKTRKLVGTILFALCLSFALWVICSLLAWFGFIGSNALMFGWSIIDMWSVLFFLFSYYFLYVFIKERDLPMWQKAIGLALILPTLYWIASSTNLNTFNLNVCEADESDFVLNYNIYFQIVFMCFVVGFVVKEFIYAKAKNQKKKIALVGTGVGLFLFCFTSGIFAERIASLLGTVVYSYNVEIYALFGMPILLIFLGFLIVKYHAFDLRVFTAQALVVTAVTIIGTQYAFLHSAAPIVLNTINLILILIVGIYLARNVKREVEQREKIEKLAVQLSSANDRLKELDKQKTEFLSIASHQLRAPLTAIKGYSSLILEGSFGAVSEKVRGAVDVVFQSSQKLVNVIEDFLNITRIELGKMKYEMGPMNLRQLVEMVLKEQKNQIAARGLQLSLDVADGTDYQITGDSGKLSQVITNLVDNAAKYTKQGGIKVLLSRTPAGKARLEVKDTGVGLTPETISHLFEKFARAHDAGKVNIVGTGLGLYVAKQIVEGHQGRIWAESEGEGKGSSFIVEI